jgi:hypothetical protein
MTTEGGNTMRAEEHEAFIRYLEKASTTIESWPEWKRTILGRTMRPNSPTSVSSIGDTPSNITPPRPQR